MKIIDSFKPTPVMVLETDVTDEEYAEFVVYWRHLNHMIDDKKASLGRHLSLDEISSIQSANVKPGLMTRLEAHV